VYLGAKRRYINTIPFLSFSFPQKGHSLPIFGPCLLWPNGWMDQGATWYGYRSRPRRHCVRWERSSPLKKGYRSSPLFDPCLLWPNGSVDQDTTCCGGTPRQARRRWMRTQVSSTERGTVAPSLFGPLWRGTVAHLSCCRALVSYFDKYLLQCNIRM